MVQIPRYCSGPLFPVLFSNGSNKFLRAAQRRFKRLSADNKTRAQFCEEQFCVRPFFGKLIIADFTKRTCYLIFLWISGFWIQKNIIILTIHNIASSVLIKFQKSWIFTIFRAVKKRNLNYAAITSIIMWTLASIFFIISSSVLASRGSASLLSSRGRFEDQR